MTTITNTAAATMATTALMTTQKRTRMRFSVDWWAYWGGIAAVVFTAAAALAGSVAWYFSNLASIDHDERVKTLETRTAEANAQAEKDRLARAKLELRTANRWLTPEEFNALSATMSKFSGQRAEVVVFPVNFESVGIADLIQGLLGNAKWKAGPIVQRLTEAPKLPTPAGTVAPFMVQGVYIRSSGDKESMAAGRALFDALSSTVASGMYDPTPLPGEPRVFILVGDKPTPLSVWVRD